MFLQYLLKFHLQDCLQILSDKDVLCYYCIKIDFMNLFEIYPDIGDDVLCNPIKTLPNCSADIVKLQQNILEQDQYKIYLEKFPNCTLKKNVHARFFGLPVCPELHRSIFPKNVDLGCFLKVTGTVVRVTQAKMLEYNRKYICVKCRYENYVKADFEHRYVLKAPPLCGNEEKKCKSSTFTQVNLISREYCKDYQEIKIQEQVNKLGIGTIPGSMWVVLEDDLVDSCKPGDDVHVCAAVRRRWRPSGNNKKCDVELVLEANYLEVCNAQRSDIVSTAPDIKDCFNDYWSKFDGCPMKGRDLILASICPQVYGLHLVKLAVLLTIITGSNHIIESQNDNKSADEHTTRVRGQCHLLLVGDPGTGKSQLLRAGSDLTPRSVFTSGAGSTRAGLTCSALREDGEWQLEAGALVLSDGGVCCIDEIGQLREHDRASIHEAMEQQTVSIAKAGIVCKLNTRCAVIAACNPKGHYDTEQPLSVNVSLGTPLLSRFDLIFILLDSKNKPWDQLVSSYILFGGNNVPESNKQWSLEKLQMYISLVGPRFTKMTKSANIILQTYYMVQRKSDYRDPSRTTVRMLDSLVRLSQAHCRLMYRNIILPMDAIVAVSLVDLSMQDCTLSDTVDALHSTFPKYPDQGYLLIAKNLLRKLNLFEIWRDELIYYAKILKVDHKTLESELENENSYIFAKYNDISDDSVPLSSTLITSSYFNGKQNKKVDFKSEKFNEESIEEGYKKTGINDKLASTLKKHATLNKHDKNPPKYLKSKGKRKRKEITIQSKSITKKVKMSKTKQKALEVDSDSEFECDNNEVLKAIPSVNDIFGDLNLDFNITNQSENLLDENKSVDVNKAKPPNKTSCDINPIKDEVLELKENTVVSKLKKFQYIEKHDLSKYADKTVITVKKESVDSNSSSSKAFKRQSTASQQSSQLSIFENSDCDIDLEL